jgi:prophage maintenance system killer protein/prophage antirepressor-like protein
MIEKNPHIPQSSIEIYTAPDNSIQLQVKLDQDTVWLTQKQLADLFGVKKAAISKHISNIFASGELDSSMTVSKMETVVNRGFRGVVKDWIDYYNLDMILSIGYRVNSRRAISFRQWANRVLKEFLIKGYAVRTNMQLQQYEELKQLVGVLQQTIQNEALTTNEARDLVKVVTDYTYALDTLDDYDYQRLAISDTEGTERFHATYENAMEAIHSLKEKFGESWLFGNEKDDSFKSSIGQIYQTFGGQELYPSVEEKAAMLLYLVTKNHSFSDGNKRIAATLFLWFMDRNGILYTPDGHKRIADNTLVALTLMIAESRTEEKDIMVKVVVNLINKKN